MRRVHPAIQVDYDEDSKTCRWYSVATDSFVEIPRDLVNGILDLLSGYEHRKKPLTLPEQYEQEVRKRVEAASAA